jgi:hypothetical protein
MINGRAGIGMGRGYPYPKLNMTNGPAPKDSVSRLQEEDSR